MNNLRTTRRNTWTSTVIALAVAGLLAGCGKDDPTSAPTPSTTPDSTTSPAVPTTPPTPEATTPPAAPEATTPPPGTPEPTTPPAAPEPPAPDNTNPGTAPGGTEPPPAAPGSGSSRLDSPGATLAQASPSALRNRYGVDLTRVTDEKSNPANTTNTNKLSRADRNFVEDALKGGLYEEAAARIGVERASTPSVKAFAEMLASQHGAANAELRQLASTWNVDIPDKLPLMKRRAVDKLRDAKDEDFEQEFIKQVGVDDHRDDIKRFEEAAREAKDPNIRAWAEKTLPTLREHLAAARDLAVASGIKIETETTARRSTSGATDGVGTGS